MTTYKPGDKLHTAAELTAALEAGCTVRAEEGFNASRADCKGHIAYEWAAKSIVVGVTDLESEIYPFEVVRVKEDENE